MKWIRIALFLLMSFPLVLKAANLCDRGIQFKPSGKYSKDYTGPVTCRDDQNNIITYRFSLKNGRYQGVYRSYHHKTGHLLSEANYEEGKKQGLKKKYDYWKGFLFSESLYEKGRLVGVEKFYHPNGHLKKLSAHGKGSGTIVRYNSKGQLSGLRCGEVSAVPEDRAWCGYRKKFSNPVTLYDSKGVIKEVVRYKGGKRHGRQEYYHRNGKLSTVRYYENGKIKKQREDYNREGKLVEFYEPTKGVYREYYSEGLLKKEVYFNKDKKPSREIFYYQNGHKKKETEHVGGGIKVEKSYFDNGQLFTSGKLKMDPYDGSFFSIGVWQHFREDGQLRYETKYEKGKILEKSFYDEFGELEVTEAYYPDGSRKYKKQHRTKVSY